MSNIDFINKIKTYAIDIYNNGGNLLPSVTIAQAILESGWGKSSLSIECNNLFGIKGQYEGNGKSYPTQEYINGKWITVQATFRKYPSMYESLLDHDNLMNLDRYKYVRESKSYQTQCKNLYMCGYATDPNYSSLLIQIIEENKLYNYDKITRSTVNEYKENKQFKVIVNILNVRNAPSVKYGSKVAEYYNGEIFNSIGWCENEGYVWRIYISYTGEKRYIATRTIDNSEIYTKTIKE